MPGNCSDIFSMELIRAVCNNDHLPYIQSSIIMTQSLQDFSIQPGAVYLAPRGFDEELAEELARAGKTVLFRRERLIGTVEEACATVWAQNTWLRPQFIPAASITDAARRLKAIQRNWALYSVGDHRRAALIQATLPKVSARPHVFGDPVPVSPLGGWTLLSRDLVLASAECSSPFANGEIHFVENKLAPPNRAYLKLWETFTRLGVSPGPGDLCLDLGSSPGGWTWVLAQLRARVFSVDKAPLAPEVARNPLVETCSGSAFALDPQLVGDADWIFCDVACYPERLHAMVKRWLDAGTRAHLVCTIKFAGKTDFSALESFLAISGSQAMHLFANKHEVTWIRLVK